MGCASVFQELASRNPFIQELEDQGFHVDFVGNYLVIYGLPYLDAAGGLQHGDWASPVDLRADNVIDPPSNHQAWFRGGLPHARNGRPLKLGGGPDAVQIANHFKVDRSFSYKLMQGSSMRAYASFEEKVRAYIDTITAPAMDAYPDATPLRGIEVKAAQRGTPLRLPDTMSARYHMNDLSAVLEGKRVAIIGLGGTGAYILDFIARTHLAEIALFDADTMHVHTVFRMPGYIPMEMGMEKVNALAQQYGNWHSNIKPFEQRITADNIDRLAAYHFVFVAVDDGPSRILIADWLTARGIPFVDCGMGLNRVLGGLNGVVRITGVDRKAFDQAAGTVHLPGGDPEGGEYRKQGQIAEMNALNASLAVIRFKQHFGIYAREEETVSITLETATFEIDPLKSR